MATYGQIASLAGMAGHARQVGYALHHLPDGSRVPWHRVINARGRISFHPSSMEWAVQKALLESEGVVREHRPGQYAGAVPMATLKGRRAQMPAGLLGRPPRRHRSGGLAHFPAVAQMSGADG